MRIHGEQVRVRAHVYSLEGFSAHADQSELIEWVSRLKTKPRHVFLVHGEDDARSALQKRSVDPVLDVSMPGLGDTVTLTSRGIADEVAATPTATDGETLALWHSVEELRRLVDVLERSPVAPSDQTKQRLIDAVNEALLSSPRGRGNGKPLIHCRAPERASCARPNASRSFLVTVTVS